jgi:hypothetical protein
MNWKLFLLFLLFWFGLLIFTGTLTSGYHFMDDHGILRESQDVSKTTLVREARVFARNLFASKMRFRPFYWVHRRVMLMALGTNFTAMSIYIGFLAVLTSFFLFLFMKKTGFSVIESILFVFLTLLGSQADIWWRLGNNETIGMFILSAALLFMANSARYTFSSDPAGKRKKILYEILFVLFVILMSWCKESFILMIPALVFGKIWLTYREKPLAAAAIKKNLAGGVFLLLVCLAELVHVVKNVGASGVGYAGYEGFRLSGFIDTAIDSFMAVHGWVIALQLAIIGALVYWEAKRDKPAVKRAALALVWPVILAGLIAVPQVVLYMKSGIMGRYLLPCVLGYTFLMTVLLKTVRLKSSPLSLENFKKSWKHPLVFVFVLLAVVLLQQSRVTRYTAIGFAREGNQIASWLQSIAQNTGPQDPILVVTHLHKHYEASISLKMYLDVKSGRENTVFSPANLEIKNGKRGFWHQLNDHFLSRFPGFSLDSVEDRRRLRAILIFPGLEKKFLAASASWFKRDNFQRYTNEGGFVGFYRLATKDTKNTKIK